MIMKKIALNIPERFVVISLLPEKGNFETLKTVDALRELIYPSEEEVKKFEIKQNAETISWNQEALKSIEYEFSDIQLKMIQGNLSGLSDKEELAYNQFLLYKKFE